MPLSLGKDGAGDQSNRFFAGDGAPMIVVQFPLG